MVDATEIDALLNVARRDVLSVSLDVDPTRPEHQVPTPAYRIWLHRAVHQVLAGISGPGRGEALETGRKVLAHVNASRPQGRGLVIFAAPNLWRKYSLPFPLPNLVRFGRPDLVPLLWAMSEYEPYAVLAVDLEHATIAMAYVGRTVVVDDKTLELDTEDWQFKSGRVGTYTRSIGVGIGRGVQADTYDARVAERQRQFWHGVAQATAKALADLHIGRMIIAGREEAASAVREFLPEAVRAHVIGTVPLPSRATIPEIQRRTLPMALADHHRQESALVADLLAAVEADAQAVVGRAPTLRSLMAGEVKTLAVARDLEGDIWQCTQCEYLSARPLRACPICGGSVDQGALRQVLPLLARRHGAALEVIGPVGSAHLVDGLGAVLRYRTQRAAVESVGR
jgi:peptide subunit release factor 1 (eRF1)